MNRLFSCSSNEVRRRAKGLSQGACLPPLVVGYRWLFFLRKENGKPIVLSAWCPALESSADLSDTVPAYFNGRSVHRTSQYLSNFRPTCVKVPTGLKPKC
jgi:hypothetical protein